MEGRESIGFSGNFKPGGGASANLGYKESQDLPQTEASLWKMLATKCHLLLGSTRTALSPRNRREGHTWSCPCCMKQSSFPSIGKPWRQAPSVQDTEGFPPWNLGKVTKGFKSDRIYNGLWELFTVHFQLQHGAMAIQRFPFCKELMAVLTAALMSPGSLSHVTYPDCK